MAAELVMVTGGVRSGKSGWAVGEASRLASGGRVAFVATADAEAAGSDFTARIARHRAQRPSHWLTLEADARLWNAISEASRQADVVLVDDLTGWISRLLEQAGDANDAEFRCLAEVNFEEGMARLESALANSDATVIVVTNEAGSGVAPPTVLGNVFADLLGSANARLSRVADRACLMVSGLPVILKNH